MTQTAIPSPDRAAGYRHEAFLWNGIESFLSRTVPFVTDALAEDVPVMVALPGSHWEPLRDALGDEARRVRFMDMTALGHNPARIIPAWIDFIAENGGGTRPLRGLGEPIWAGRREPEIVECQVHEVMLNVAVPATMPFWLLCPYDAAALPPDVLDHARRSHPSVVGGEPTDVVGTDVIGTAVRSAHLDPLSLFARELPAPGGPTEELTFGHGGLASVRRLVERVGAQAGVSAPRLGDVILGVNEVAANSLDHGGGTGVLRAWREADAVIFEVSDRGRIADPLVGRTTPTAIQPRGRGLWMVNRLCDLVQIRSTPAGTVIRVVTWL